MFTTRPELRGTFGVVASTHWLASAVGMSILERGGNAFDPAGATAVTPQIVEPHLHRPGRRVAMLLWGKKKGAARGAVGQGVTPAEAAAAGGDREAQIEAARRAWYQGFVAEAIDQFCRTEVMDNSGRRHRGMLNGDDMARWEATVETPLTYDYHGHTVAKCGPWTQGPIFLQQLALLRDFDLAGMDPLGATFLHTVTEAAKLAFADREAWYADPNFTDVPMATLLSDAYNAQRRTLIGETAS